MAPYCTTTVHRMLPLSRTIWRHHHASTARYCEMYLSIESIPTSRVPGLQYHNSKNVVTEVISSAGSKRQDAVSSPRTSEVKKIRNVYTAGVHVTALIIDDFV